MADAMVQGITKSKIKCTDKYDREMNFQPVKASLLLDIQQHIRTGFAAILLARLAWVAIQKCHTFWYSSFLKKPVGVCMQRCLGLAAPPKTALSRPATTLGKLSCVNNPLQDIPLSLLPPLPLIVVTSKKQVPDIRANSSIKGERIPPTI